MSSSLLIRIGGTPDEDLDHCVTEGSQRLSWWGTQPLGSSNSRQCGGLGRSSWGARERMGSGDPAPEGKGFLGSELRLVSHRRRDDYFEIIMVADSSIVLPVHQALF